MYTESDLAQGMTILSVSDSAPLDPGKEITISGGLSALPQK